MGTRKARKPEGVNCPICGDPLPEEVESPPFCSMRCRMVDLNRWLGGEYRLSRPLEQRDIEEGE